MEEKCTCDRAPLARFSYITRPDHLFGYSPACAPFDIKLSSALTFDESLFLESDKLKCAFCKAHHFSLSLIFSMLRGIRPNLARASKWAHKRTLATTTNTGDNIHGYNVVATKDVPEFDLRAILLKHDKTGAQHLHIDREDANNVFSIGFKTNPPNRTGVPHILEHTTLCGSEKYQVRDPFFKMLNRSLANFMNAMTAQDYTFYPFATTNATDMVNLRDVYLDATLNPLLRELDFSQEGWRLEHEDPNDAKTPIILKGVVFNEMKGQMSNAAYAFYIRYLEQIYPSLNNSGGDPLAIPELTYDGLKDFHKNHYNPGNARTFTYGNIPVGDHLKALNDKFAELKYDNVVKSDPKSDYRAPLEFSNRSDNTRIVEDGPIDTLLDESKQHKLSLSWLMGTPNDIYESFCVKIISSLLIDGHSSPIHQKLIDSGLGSAYSPNTGLDSAPAANILSVGLQGVAESDVATVEQTILDTIKDTIKAGFDKGRIDGLIHQTELARKDQNAKFGMALMNGVLPGWFNQVDPLEALEWNKILEQFQKDMAANPKFLEDKMQKYLVDSKYFHFQMNPNADYEKNVQKKEDAILTEKLANLSESDKKDIYETGQNLQKMQEEPENLDCLPTLNVEDIPRSKARVKLDHTKNPYPIQWRLAPTNGLTYFHSIASLEGLPHEYYPYLPLFTSALTFLGTKTKSMGQLEDEIKLKTGGLDFSVSCSSSPLSLPSSQLNFAMDGVALDKNVSSMFSLFQELLRNTDFTNVEKLKTMISASTANLSNALAQSGHSFAMLRAASDISPVKQIDDILGGVGQVRFLSELAAKSESDLVNDVVPKLQQIAAFALTREQRFAVTCGQDMQSTNDELVRKFADSFPAESNSKFTTSSLSIPMQEPLNTLFKLPFQVNYAGIAIPGVPYTHQDGAPLQVLANMLTHKHLHREIREKGGAYGGGASYNPTDGFFSYYSYRDPNLERTLKTCQEAGVWATKRDWTPSDLQEAKLSLFQRIDAPISVKSEGMALYANGLTYEQREKRRQQLLDVKADDVYRVANDYLVKPKKYSVAALGPGYEGMKDWKVLE